MSVTLDDKTIEALREKGRESLFFLARGILGFDKLDVKIHKPICDALQESENTRVLIVLPRDWFKSTIGSLAYPIWRAIRDSNIRVLIVQNSYSNACKKLSAIRQVFEKNALFQALYPDILPDKQSGQWSSDCLTIKRSGSYPEGTFEAAGTGTAITSRHYDLVIEDDTVAPEHDSMSAIMQQPTQLEIEKAIGFHRLVYPLLLHPSESQIVVIGTRWAERDLIGWIEQNSPEFLKISRGAREDEFGNPDPEGKPVWERFSEDVLGQLKRTQGPYMFSMLYLNIPVSAVNQVFKRDWISYYSNRPKGLTFCTSVDPAPSDKETSGDPDYNVVLTTGINPETGEIFVVYYNRERCNPGELINRIFDHDRLFNPMVVKVESVAYQRTLSYWIQRRQSSLNRRFYIEEVKSARVSKGDRIRSLQPYFAVGNIHIKTDMAELERELLAFPSGAHDDILDALSMQVGFWEQETRMKREEVARAEREEPFSGASVLRELGGRVENLRRFPNDVGLLGERLGRRLREYV